jgi:hypothetical protein
MFNSVVKLVPQLEVEETIWGAKQLVEDQLQLMDWAEELERINNKKKGQ